MVESLRQDKARVVSGEVHPGLYLVSDGAHCKDSKGIRSLISLGDDIFSSSTVIGSRFCAPDLLKIADYGDIVRVDYKSRTIRAVLSVKAKQNTLLVTEECDNLCVFCSQPPKPSGHFYEDALLALSNFQGGGVIGITGGEPTYFWNPFREFLAQAIKTCPEKSFHLLTHGRTFADINKAKELQKTGAIKKVLFGVPLHGPTAEIHDLITGVPGSFDETVAGLLNLAFCGASLEIRIVVNKYNYKLIGSIVEFVRARFRSVKPVIAIMQLEPVGWAKNRYDELYVSSDLQRTFLDSAIQISDRYDGQLTLFNYPLCHLTDSAQKLAAQSISDWKNYFPQACDLCTLRQECCGYFSSAKGSHIENPRPFL